MRRLLVSFGLVLGTAATALAAPAQVIERVQIAQAGRPATASIPAGVSLLLVSPPDYSRAAATETQGTWVGPDYRAAGKPDLGGRAAIRWQVGFDTQSRSSEAAALAGLSKRWRETLRGGVSVPHVVGRTTVGTIDGDYVLTIAPEPDAAAQEAALAFAIAPGVHATVSFVASEPADNSADTFGAYQVFGSIGAATWNRGQLFRALTGVRLDGNLPPTRVTALAARRTIRGTVGDAFRHPVVGARVALQRANGTGGGATTRTDSRGAYKIGGVSRGRYRVVATVGTSSATSPVVVSR